MSLIINRKHLPPEFPTHRHTAEFWMELGRTVATFGCLEEVLCKAHFAFLGTRELSAEEMESEFVKLMNSIERSLSDTLGGLIEKFGSSIRKNSKSTITNLDDLLDDLRIANLIRNALCHGSWREPDDDGKSLIFYFDKKRGKFQDEIDIEYLQRVRANAVDLICSVIDTVTHAGFQFPGSSGPGKVVW